MKCDITIVIAGEAGQGLVTFGQLLSKVLVRSGYEILVTQSYHSRIRGGHNTFAIRVSTERLLAPRDRIDLLVAFNTESIDLHQNQLTKKGRIIADQSVTAAAANTVRVPFQEFGPQKFWNTAALGVLGSMLGLDLGRLFAAIEGMFGIKHPEALSENKKVLEMSGAWASDHGLAGLFTLPDQNENPARLILNGNEAIAIGAMAGGVQFCSFYPMTPATSIVLNLIQHADTMGLVIEQAEDEIAAINMAIGASYAGAVSLVATSGGGFALMTEGVSLAGMTETPLVIIVAQRPGPATGMPTRTEQGDLECVLHGGHGEFPRAIYAPGSLESCFRLSQLALLTAERFQTPVFLLTDQFLADSSRAIPPFDLTASTPVSTCGNTESIQAPYKRYALTSTGISPRLLPGESEHLVAADSDEHDETGHISEDHATRIAMMQKRLKKYDGLQAEVLAPVYDGAIGAELLLVCWGSSHGPVQEACKILREQGGLVATLHFEQLWPLLPEQFLTTLQSATEVVCVEGNATAQFSKLIRRETGFAMHNAILRYDGLPFTAQYILDGLELAS